MSVKCQTSRNDGWDAQLKEIMKQIMRCNTLGDRDAVLDALGTIPIPPYHFQRSHTRDSVRTGFCFQCNGNSAGGPPRVNSNSLNPNTCQKMHLHPQKNFINFPEKNVWLSLRLCISLPAITISFHLYYVQLSIQFFVELCSHYQKLIVYVSRIREFFKELDLLNIRRRHDSNSKEKVVETRKWRSFKPKKFWQK